MKKKFLLGAAFGALAAANPLMAADLPVKAPIYKAPPVAVYNWTGCYGGANVGYSWGRSNGEFDFPALANFIPPLPTAFPISTSPQGVIGGVQIGCDQQVNNTWVIGVEADIQGSAQKATRTFSAFNAGGEGFSGNFTSQLHWFGTLRGVVGFLATPTVMLYGTGGLAYGNASISSTIAAKPFGGVGGLVNVTSASSSADMAGYAVGAGIAGAFPNSSNWTWKLEYLYVSLGSLSAVGLDPILGPYSWSTSRITDNILRVGVNYRFSSWGAAPVVAKY